MIARFRTIALAVACLTLSSNWLRGAEVYVLRFRTDVIYADATRCLTTGWQDELLFHNPTNTEKVIRLLSATSGAIARAGEVAVEPGTTASTLTDAGIGLGGDPFGFVLVEQARRAAGCRDFEPGRRLRAANPVRQRAATWAKSFIWQPAASRLSIACSTE